MSSTYISTILLFITAIANALGFEVVEEQLQATISVIVAIGTGLWVLIERYKKGGIDAFGIRK